MKPSLLLMVPLLDGFKQTLGRYYDCHDYSSLNEQQLEVITPLVRGIVSAANASVPRTLISQLPALEMISVLGVGYDGVDLDAALISALREGKILAAGLDVFSDEPAVSQELRELPNVVLTPHMASGTEATVQAMMEMVLDNLRSYFEGKPVLNRVN